MSYECNHWGQTKSLIEKWCNENNRDIMTISKDEVYQGLLNSFPGLRMSQIQSSLWKIQHKRVPEPLPEKIQGPNRSEIVIEDNWGVCQHIQKLWNVPLAIYRLIKQTTKGILVLYAPWWKLREYEGKEPTLPSELQAIYDMCEKLGLKFKFVTWYDAFETYPSYIKELGFVGNLLKPSAWFRIAKEIPELERKDWIVYANPDGKFSECENIFEYCKGLGFFDVLTVAYPRGYGSALHDFLQKLPAEDLFKMTGNSTIHLIRLKIEEEHLDRVG